MSLSSKRQSMQLKQTYATLGQAVLLVFGLIFVRGQSCDDGQGICKPMSQCHIVAQTAEETAISKRKYCNVTTGVVCCPLPPVPAKCNINIERKFERACRRYSRIVPRARVVPFIIDGTRAKPKELPFMALLGTKQSHRPTNWNCAGTLISEQFVLTALHCLVVHDNDTNVQVRLGELDYNSSDDDARPQHFTHKTIHYFDSEEEEHDIALIELNQTAILNEYVLPACLPDPSCGNFANYAVAGWGLVDPYNAKNKSSHLLKTLLKPIQGCGEPRNSSAHVYAGSPTSGRDTCHGDSGGPLFWNHPNYQSAKLVIGITSISMGQLCDDVQGDATLYTNVSAYIDWIEGLVWPN